MSELLRAEDIGFAYRGGNPVLHGVGFSVTAGEHVGIVGESGAGKTTLLRILLGLSSPTSGRLLADGTPLVTRDRARLRAHRRFVQPVFQDPYSSLDPRQRVGSIVAEPVRALGLARGDDLLRRAEAALVSVGLPGAGRRYPHQFSGGQRQRIAIARAIAAGPSVLLADEPVSALDMSTRLEVIDLLAELGRGAEHPITVVLVSHDLGVVARLCRRVLVLEAGTIVEQGEARSVLSDPQHPYTQRLLTSVPRLDPQGR